MTHIILAAAALGIAGFDPLGFVALVAAMAFTGILVGLSAFIDPAFYGAIVLAARQPNPVANAVVIASWIALSHSALILMGTATLVGWFESVNHFLTRMRQRWGATANQAFTIALLLAGLFGLVQGIAEWRGHWLDLGLHLHSRPHR